MKKKLFSVLVIILLIPCLSFATFATTVFTPSVEAKDAPPIVSQNGVFAVLLDKDGSIVSQIKDKSRIIITPMSQSASADTDVRESLTKTFQRLKKADSLANLMPGIDNTLNKLHPGFSVSNLVARDLFNISVRGNTPISETNQLRITLYLGIFGSNALPASASASPTIKNLMISQKPSARNLTSGQTPKSDIVIAAFCDDDKNWPVIDPSKVVNNGDGTVTLTLSQTGTLLIMVEGTGSTVPAMSSGLDYRFVAAITAVCVAALTAFAISFDNKQRVKKVK